VVSPYSSAEFDPSYDILNLANVANILAANSIPQVSSVIHLKVLISTVFSRRLLMIVSALLLVHIS